MVNDIILTCGGGSAGSRQYHDIYVYFNTNLTSRVIDSSTSAIEGTASGSMESAPLHLMTPDLPADVAARVMRYLSAESLLNR